MCTHSASDHILALAVSVCGCFHSDLHTFCCFCCTFFNLAWFNPIFRCNIQVALAHTRLPKPHRVTLNRPFSFYTSALFSRPSRPIHLDVHAKFDSGMVGNGILTCHWRMHVIAQLLPEINDQCFISAFIGLHKKKTKKKLITFLLPVTKLPIY